MHNNDTKYQLKTATWDKDKEALIQIRRTVFIDEQNVPEELEWDEYDKDAIHILVTDKNNKPLATGRMKLNGHIGRMAVIKSERLSGIGTQILHKLLEAAHQHGLHQVYLHSQITAIPFYKKLGFEICSDEFMDAGIAHKTMQLTLK